MSAFQVLFLPGVVLPAGPAYERLVAVLGPDVETIVKDLEVYRAALSPPDYSLDTEIAGVLREADERGWSSFHLVGYSGGGAAALACAASVPSRLLSLGLLEPAWAGSWDRSPGHERLWARYDELARSPHEEFMAAFMRLQVRPEVRLPSPPPGPPPAWMAQRPEGIRALLHTFKTYDLDRDALAAFERPVYFALGGLSNPDQFGDEADRLATSFPTSRSKSSPSGTTSIRPIASSRNGSRRRSAPSGRGATRHPRAERSRPVPRERWQRRGRCVRVHLRPRSTRVSGRSATIRLRPR